jgi:hypothetical protein
LRSSLSLLPTTSVPARISSSYLFLSFIKALITLAYHCLTTCPLSPKL